jgi:hypothetical protein
MADQFNTVNGWIALAVATTENPKLRCKILKKMILIAGEYLPNALITPLIPFP